MPVPAIITGPLVNPAASASASSSSSSALVIPQSAPAGSVVITQPPQTATSYFKLAPSQTITFGWNFTDVLASPTSLTVSAACDNGNTYAVGPTNGIIPGSATTVLWDLYSYQQANPATPLVQGTYTLMMWDDRGPNVPREPGYMVPNNALRFAIYTPQSYTGLGDGWQCTICSGSLSAYTSHPAFAGILTAFLIMILSGFSLFRFGFARRP
ncbi:hypothetical protein AX14_012630 [Amanita brunnescens Koide BX004]|nr:hypothetical protein AX14_012630 [Amanita brunnescens Koide BX004]